MEEKFSNISKPLRTTANKVKDLLNTYKRNEEGRSIQPVNISETDNFSKNKIEDGDKKPNLTVEEKELELNEQQIADQELIAEFISKFEELIKERDEQQEQVKRIAAELENFRRRSIREKQEMIDYANERLLFKMLPLLDDINSAIDSGRQSNDFNGLLTGVEMIFQKAIKIFDEAGVKPITDPVGKPFDLDYHEAVALTPSELPIHYVVYQVSPGYTMHNKVLRHSKVITSSGPVEKEETSDSFNE
jgi:molecular chaperone GrpE